MAYLSYMGLQNSENTASPTENSMSSTPTPSYSNIEIGGGCITGTESVDGTSRNFAMYHAGQYMPPSHGDYEMVQSVDGANWYKQYAQDAVERRPYETEMKKLPTMNPLFKSFHQYCNEKSGYKVSEQQNGFDEAVQVGTSTAYHIKSLKTISLLCQNCKRGLHCRTSRCCYWCCTTKP